MSLYGGITLPGHPSLENVRRLDLIADSSIRRMHRYGFAIDVPYCHDLSSSFRSEMVELEKDIISYIPREKLHEFADKAVEDAEEAEEAGVDADEIDFNVASSDQIRKLLFETLGLGRGKELKRTASGEISTGKAQLRDIEREHPVVPLILAYRERAKLIGTYTSALPRIARFHPRGACCPVCELPHRADTWRVHSEIVQTRAATGRMASRKPNIQNVPQRTELGSRVRAAFIASPGCKLISADFSQVELRMMAHLANCASMLDTYRRGGDLHVETAMKCFGIDDPKKLDKISHRIPAKTAGFLCIASGQRVLTDKGLVEIQNVTCHHKVWDGIEWVSHQGLIFKGYQDVIEYDGLTATPDHEVWTEDGAKTTLEQARREGVGLAATGVEEVPVRFTADRRQADHTPTGVSGSRRFLRTVQAEQASTSDKYRAWQDNELPLLRPDEVYRPEGEDAGVPILGYLAEMYEPKPSELQKLRRAWNQVYIYVSQAIRSLRPRESASRNLQGDGYRKEEQQRELLTRQHSTGDASTESVQQTYESVRHVPREEDRGELLAYGVKSGHSRIRSQQGEDYSAGSGGSAVAADIKGQAKRSIQVPVYDILNAGPRHRFTVEGKLVSNCLYGGSGKALYAQLLMAMLILISEKKLDRVPDWLTIEWCEQFVEEYFKVRPELRDYQELQEYRTKRYNMVWDLTGRVRLTPEARSYHPWIKSAGYRQGGNMADQGTSSALMKLTCGEVDNEYLKKIWDGGAGTWCWPLLPIHDQLIIEADETIDTDILDILTYVMDNVSVDKESGENLLRVEIKSDGEILDRWLKPEEHQWNPNTRQIEKISKK